MNVQAEAVIEKLVADFDQWRSGDGDPTEFELMLEWKIDYGDGCLDLWSAYDVDEFVLNWCPRKVSAPPSWARSMVRTVAAGFDFLGERGLLARGSDPAPQLAGRARSLEKECVRRMGDSSNFGMAKSLLSGMGADLSEDLSQEVLEGHMDQFNALPDEQREAMTGGPLPEHPVIGPVMLPTAQDIIASAGAAPVLVGFRALSDYFVAPGRALTTTGNVKLADADALSGILGTEPTGERVGGRTVRRQSASSMPDLDHWLWWAAEAGVLRASKGKLVAVKAWRDRCAKEPLSEAYKAFELLDSFGFISSYRPHTPQPNDEVMDFVATALLGIPLQAGGPVDFGELVDSAKTTRDRVGVPDPWGNNRASIARDVDLILKMAERAGLVVQHDVSRDATAIGSPRVGGAVSLTPFGVHVVVEVAREQGVIVETVGAVEGLSAQKMAEVLQSPSLDTQAWWGLLGRWVDAQPQPDKALAGLLARLETHDLMLVLLGDTPEDLVDVFSSAMLEHVKAGDPDEPVTAIAFGWLVEQGYLDPDSVGPESAHLHRLSLLGLFAVTDPESIAHVWGQGRPRPELLADIGIIASLMPLNALELLERIGKSFPDKVVAKEARRASLKVRSRLAGRGR